MYKSILLFLISSSISEEFGINLFFKDLSSHPVYKKNHIFQALDTVAYRDSIMYVQETDYLLINTNNTILNLDIYTLEVIQRLLVSERWTPNLCYVDVEALDYPCHLFGYWSKIIAMSTDPSVNQLFVCHNDGRATYHNLKDLEVPSSSESKCPSMSVLSMFSTDYHFYVTDIKDGRKVLRFQPNFSVNMKTTKKKSLHTSIDSSWLQQNDYLQFVFIFENENFVYFVFREIAEEDFSYCHVKEVKSRIARISKDDKGGTNFRLVNTWITFVKATLICFDSDSNNIDTSLRYVESIYYDNERKFVYATFSSSRYKPISSAICQYSINDIDLALDGLYMNVKEPKTQVPKYNTDCTNFNEDCKIQRAVKYQLKFSPIIPSFKRNFVQQSNEIWTHIQVMTIERSSRQYDIIFVATSKNKVKKFYRKLTDNFLCYSETLTLSDDDNNVSSIRDMKIINSKKSPQLFLLITVTKGVYRIAIEHCEVHLTELLCKDPFCHWESSLGKCKSIFQLEHYKLRQLPQLTQCTDGNELYNSIWKQWTSWKKSEDNNCESRMRVCKEGQCVNTGSFVENIDIQVKNCSNHNQWTTWSHWSACSSTCGKGIKTRKRWCFQNATCPGNDKESDSCIIDNKCKEGSNLAYISWSEWSKCSTDCGEGIMLRNRRCIQYIGSDNNTCNLIETKKCKENNCKEFSTYVIGDLKDGSSESLYLGSCYGTISQNNDLEASVEYDVMTNNDSSDLVWQCWSDWSNCTSYCSDVRDEESLKWRTRTCKIEDPDTSKKLCLGLPKEVNVCKEENCLESMMNMINEEKGFQLVYIILVGVAVFTGTCLIVIIGVCIYFEKNKPISKLASFNTDTIGRRPTYMRTSYSPITHSPPASPMFKSDPYSTDTYNSLNRIYRRPNPTPVYVSTPRLTDEIPMASMH